MGKRYGYARISTKKQSLERQIDNIMYECHCAEIYSEAYTGTKSDRPEWKKLLKKVKTGDTIIFDSVSRMSRNAEEGIEQYFELYDKGINLIFLKERHIDTDAYKKAMKESGISIDTDNNTAEGELISDIAKALNKFMRAKAKDDIRKAFEQSEKEVIDLQIRTMEGMRVKHAGDKISEARTGMKITTKKSIDMKDKIIKMAKDFNGSMTDKDVIETLGIARNTYFKYKREIKAEREV